MTKHSRSGGAATGFTLALPDELVRRAYAGTSFDPERRGRRVAEEYDYEIKHYIEKMRWYADKGGTQHLVDEQIERYIAEYRYRVVALLRSESRCVSSFIAGSSNFPARCMQKRANIAHKRLNELNDFRYQAIKAALRVLRPDLHPITSGDADALERLEAEIHKAEQVHSQMKRANYAIRKYAKDGTNHQVAALMEEGFTETTARKLLVPDFCGRIGFPSYALAKSSANLRQMRQRLEQLERAKATPVTEDIWLKMQEYYRELSRHWVESKTGANRDIFTPIASRG